MTSSSDSSSQHSSAKRPIKKGVNKAAFLRLQKTFGFMPRNFCLLSGAPRSGTTALCDWLSHQRGAAVFFESRILVSIHRFMEESHRFRNLDKNSSMISKLARNLVLDYYSSSQKLVGKKLLIDKEPLEPIAFPLKDYEKFIVNVKKLFPESKLLLVIRDPIATIWSMSRRKWGGSQTNEELKEFTLEEYIDNWSSCANLILKYSPDPNTYIVRYGRLINNRENESKRIFAFLNLKGNSFQPRPTKEIGFNNDERENILRMVQPQLKLLKAQGISDF